MFNSVPNNKFDLDLQTIVRCQPIRLKALLDSFKSDEEESEDTSCKSEDESGSDNSLLLPQSDPFKNELQELVTLDCEKLFEKIKQKDEVSEATCISPKESHDIATNKFFDMQDNIKCVNEKAEFKISDVNTDKHLPIEDLNKPDFYNTVHKEKTHDINDISKKPKSNITYNHSTDVVLPSPSVSIYKENCIKNFDTNTNTQVTNDVQLHHEDDHISNVLNQKKEEHKGNASVEEKNSLERNSKNYSLDLNKEDQRYKDMQNFTEQMNKDSDENCENNSTNSTAGLESTSCKPQTFGNLTHSAMYSSQYNIMKHDANEKYTSAKNACVKFSTPLLKKTGNPTINDFIPETPLKHLQIDSTHPNASTLQKQLLQTPQGELSKNHVQTPSMIISSWSNNNMRYTPIESKRFVAKDYAQTPRNSVYTPIAGKQESSRHFEKNAKNVRRPLVDTALSRVDSLELKTPVLHTCSEPQDIAPEIQSEDKNREMIGLSGIKLIPMETNYDNNKPNLKLIKSPQKAKENKHPNMLQALLENNKQIVYDKKDGESLMAPCNLNTKLKLDLPQKHKKENNITSNAECKDLHNPYLNRQKQQELKQITDKVASIQFTIPSSIPPQRQSKTLFVKDREYLILGTLGRGMSGEVLRVQDVYCGELRAIKCVDLSKMDKESAQGCLDEISMLHKLQAPCVIRMFDYQIKESMVYVVMEMGDTDLSWLIKSISQEKQIPLTMILYYWTEMLTAVKHIHDNGVIHSDLKPANFLLVRGRLKLIDFGIASNINSEMTSVLKNNPIGTLNYISPEALMDAGGNTDSPTHKVKYKISFKSDVWSLGCILYSLVYGHTPFHHIRSQWAKVNAITNSKTKILFPITEFSNGNSQYCERVPPVLIDVLRKCLQHDPKARPTVAELLQVQYVPTKQDVKSVSKSDLPANIFMKIKHTLNEEEWREFVQVMDIKRYQYT